MTAKGDHPGAAADPLPRALSIAWGSGAFCQAIASAAVSVLLFRYLTDTVAIGAALVGLIIAASKIYDAVIDPTIGILSDRIQTPMGRRRPWMLIGGVGLALSMLVLFNVPQAASLPLKVAWVAAGLVLFSTGYSLFAIPWLAMPAEMTDDYHQRTDMMGWRVLFASGGQTAFAFGGPVLLSVIGAGALAYGRMGAMLGVACLAAAMLSVWFLKTARAGEPEVEARPSLLIQLRLAMTNGPFVTVLLIKALLYFASALQSGAMALFTRRVLNVSDLWLGVYLLMSTTAAIASQPLWIALSRRFGKRAAVSVAMVLQAIVMSSFLLAEPGQPVALLMARGLALGCASGGVFMLAQSLLPDVIEYDFRRTGMRRAGSFAGAVSFLETAAGAMGIFVLGLLLSGMGYVEGLAVTQGQPPTALLAIRLACSLLPAATMLCCLAVVSRYSLTEAQLKAAGPST